MTVGTNYKPYGSGPFYSTGDNNGCNALGYFSAQDTLGFAIYIINTL